MSDKKKISSVSDVLDGARQAATQLKPVAERVKPVAERVKPFAQSTGAAARHQARQARAWAAPQVERTGQVFQETVAPKVSAMLSSAAQRIDPSEKRRGRWRKPVGLATMTAAAAAAAAFIRSRMRLSLPAAPDSPAAPVPPATAVPQPGSKPKDVTVTP